MSSPLSPTLKRKRTDSTVNAVQAAIEGSASVDDNVSAGSASYDEVDPERAATSVDCDESNIDGDPWGGQELDDVFDEEALEDVADAIALRNDGNPAFSAYKPSEVRQLDEDFRSVALTHRLIQESGLSTRDFGRSIGLTEEVFDDLPDDLYEVLLTRTLVKSLTRRRKLSQYNTVDDAAELLKKSNHILVITGAGISTSLGIPDFRSKGTGFYSKVQDLGYSEPEDVFDIHIFDETPEIFYSLAGEILPAGKAFTPTHAFIRMLQDRSKLQTNYTQNIDNIEANAGIDPEKVVQCHGSFATASCRKCKHQVPGENISEDIRAKRVALCKMCIQELSQSEPRPTIKKAKARREESSDDEADDNIPTPGVMKPDITFFGEQLSNSFFHRFLEVDSAEADLVIVLGTSMKVAPVSEMPHHMPEEVPHIYISREPCEHINFDIQLLGDCDKVVWELARRAGWTLTHEMIPERMDLAIDQLQGRSHHWIVKTDRNEEPQMKQAANELVSKILAITAPHDAEQPSASDAIEAATAPEDL